MSTTPSTAVVRSIIAQHSPRTLELLDGLKERFGAKLVRLSVPAAGLEIGSAKWSDSAIEREFIPWVANYDGPAEAKQWAAIKAKSRAQQARGGARRRAR